MHVSVKCICIHICRLNKEYAICDKEQVLYVANYVLCRALLAYLVMCQTIGLGCGQLLTSEQS